MKNTVNKTKLITQNAIYLLLGRIVSGLLQLVLLAAIARQLGVGKFGIYTLSLTIAGIFGLLSDFGSSHLMIREVAKDKTKAGKYFLNGTIVKILLHCLFFAIFFFFINHLSSANYKNTLFLACISAILAMFANFYISFFNAFEKMHFTAFLTSIQSILVSITCLSIIFIGSKNVSYIFCCHILVNILMVLVSLVLMFKIIPPQVSILDFKFAWQFLKDATPFGIFVLGGMLYFQTDTVMLSILKNQTAVGLYQAPMRLILALDIFPSLLSTAMYPTISRTFINSKDETIAFVARSVKYLLLIGLPIALGMCLFSKHIILLVFGDQFIPSILLLIILSWIFPIRIFCHILGTTLLATNRQNIRALATGLSACLNIVLNLMFIPRYSYNGAAFASVMTSGFLAFFYYFSIRNEFQNTQLKKALVLPIASVLIMGITVHLMKGMNTYTVVITAVVVYLGCLYLFKVIKKDNLLELKHYLLKLY